MPPFSIAMAVSATAVGARSVSTITAMLKVSLVGEAAEIGGASP